MHYFLIAGEASGDLHGAELIAALRARDPEARFTFLGGDAMARAAGCAPVVHYSRMAFMGFSEVLRNLGTISGNLRAARRALSEARPDVFVPVDLPSFNLKVAKTARSLGIPVCWYISPKLWAWKAWRLKSIRRVVDRMMCILPFEPAWYAERGYSEAVYVGNPSVEEIDRALAAVEPREEWMRRHRLRSNRPLLALLPGSRRGAIRCNLPVMDAVARRFPQYTIAVAGAPGIDEDFYAGLTKFQVVRGATHEMLAHSRAALVTSGTATLEAALAGVPQVVMYRSNGSRLAYELMHRVVHVEYVSLPDLIVGRGIVPEMLLHMCTPEAVADRLAAILRDGDARDAQLAGYAEMRALLGPAGAAARAAEAVEAVARR